MRKKETLEQKKITTAIVTPEIYQSPDLIQNLFECIRYKIDFINLSEFYEALTQKVPLTAINQIWFLENISQSITLCFSGKRFFRPSRLTLR